MVKKKTLFACIFFLLFLLEIHPQSFVTRNYSKKDGLPGTRILTLIQDTRGYVLIGMDKGLFQFDGVSFKPVNLEKGEEESLVRVIYQDSTDTIWVATQTRGIKYINLPDKLISTDDSFKTPVYSITEESKNNIWLGTENGLFQSRKQIPYSFVKIPEFNTTAVFKVTMDSNKRLWIASIKGIFFRENSKFIEFKLPDNYKRTGFYTVLPDSNGRLWIGTPNGLICHKDGIFKPYTQQDGIRDNHITSILEDRKKTIWVGTWNGLYAISQDTITPITTKNGLPHNFIYSMIEDSEGNIWIATHSGLCCLRSLNMIKYSTKDGLPNNNIYDIIQDREGRYWIGTANGLGCYEQGTFKNYHTEDGLIQNSIQALLEDKKGRIWIGTLGGLVSFESGRLTPHPQLREAIFELKEGRDGTIWIGSNSGIYQMRNNKLSPPPFKNPRSGVFYILEDRSGNIWFSTLEGLHKYSRDHLQDFSKKKGELLSNHIRTIFEDRTETIWIGSERGLSCYKNNNFIHYTTKDGLPDNTCNVLLEDRQGTLWIGTENGLANFNGKTFKTYTASRHGLITDYWNSGILDDKGKFWLGSQEGLISFTPPPILPNVEPPPIYITSVKVLEKETPLSQLHSLNYKQNYLRFQFNGLCLSAPESVTYKINIVGTNSLTNDNGIEDDWVETQSSTVFYQYLPPGEYQFRVKAVNNDGIESREPEVVSFQIHPPFWKTWWFIVLVFLATITLTFIFVRLRYTLVREKAELKAKNNQLIMAQRMELMGTLAAGSVHDLKNLLSIILGSTRIMSRNYNPEDNQYKYIETIKDTATTAVQMSKQILSLARYPNDVPAAVELSELLEEIIETSKVIIPENIQLQYHPPKQPVYLAIHPARFQQIVMNLCQNAVHAMPRGGQLTITLSSHSQGKIIMEIKDTGTGIDTNIKENIFKPLFTTKEEGKGSGLGLFVVKQIVDQHQGTISVQSEPGKGTTFSISFPA